MPQEEIENKQSDYNSKAPSMKFRRLNTKATPANVWNWQYRSFTVVKCLDLQYPSSLCLQVMQTVQVSLGHWQMWWPQHQHVKPVNKDQTSVSTAQFFCFGRLRNVPVPTLKLVPFKKSPALSRASAGVEYPLTVKTHTHSTCLCKLHFPQFKAVCHYVSLFCTHCR